MSKPGKSLKALCKKLGVRLTVKRGKKRVYKSIKVLKGQCKRKAGKKKIKRRRKFGSSSINKSPMKRSQPNIVTSEFDYEPPEHDDLLSVLQNPIRYDSSGQRRRKVIPRKRDSDYVKARVQIIKEAEKDREDMWRKHGFQDNPQGKYEELLKKRLDKRKSPYPLTYFEAAARERADVDARIKRATKRQKRRFGKKKKVSRKKGPSASLKKLCKKLGVRFTTKRGKKRVYKSVKVLKAQCAKKKKVKRKKKKVKRRRKFGDPIVRMVPVNLKNIQIGSYYTITKKDGEIIKGRIMSYQGPNYYLNNNNNALPGERPYIYVVSFDNRRGNTHHRIYVDEVSKYEQVDFLNLPEELNLNIRRYLN